MNLFLLYETGMINPFRIIGLMCRIVAYVRLDFLQTVKSERCKKKKALKVVSEQK